jgi:hypothetical protein
MTELEHVVNMVEAATRLPEDERIDALLRAVTTMHGLLGLGATVVHVMHQGEPGVGHLALLTFTEGRKETREEALEKIEAAGQSLIAHVANQRKPEKKQYLN